MLITGLIRGVYRLLMGKPPRVEPERKDVGVVFTADGVGGFDLCATSLEYLTPLLDPPVEARTLVWGHGPTRWFADLTRRENVLAQGERLAREVEVVRHERPGVPIYLVGKSGGSVVIVAALERLPSESVEAVVLLAPALSPDYDLGRALDAVRRELVVHWSPYDVVVLGIGTSLFGTIDRKHAAAAGQRGFDVDKLTPERRAKLRQVRWRPEMMRVGYFGGHIATDNPLFLKKYVTPLLRVEPRTPPPVT